MSRRARTPDPFERRIESALRPDKFVSYSDSFVFAKGPLRASGAGGDA